MWSEGTERCTEALQKLTKKFDIVVNIQGDEPLIDPEIIDGVVMSLQVTYFASHVTSPPLLLQHESRNTNQITMFVSNFLFFWSLFNSTVLSIRLSYLWQSTSPNCYVVRDLNSSYLSSFVFHPECLLNCFFFLFCLITVRLPLMLCLALQLLLWNLKMLLIQIESSVWWTIMVMQSISLGV